MYKNAGAKVKGLATTIAIIMMVIFGFAGLITMFENFFVGLVTILVGCLSAWLIGLMLAAFGELVENTYYIRKQLTEGNPPVNAAPARPVYAEAPVYAEPVPQPRKETPADTTFYAPANNSFVNPNPNPASAPATCPNCGSPRKGNSAFCGFCGTRL